MRRPESLLASRERFARQRVTDLRARIASIDQLRNCPDLAIYVTGSFGRLEASRTSDLDLFFVVNDMKKANGKVGNIDKTLIDAQIIEIARALRFPEFTNEGQYLQIHSLESMLTLLGHPKDDYDNLFTARLLLLLEGRALCNDIAYDDVMKRIVESYFRDYHDHTEDFRPLFLVNDIVRFWKTLCLNYEHRRNRPEKRSEKVKSNLKNLKLKFSRLMTCFSMVVALSPGDTSSPEQVLKLARIRPIDRLRTVVESKEQRRLLAEILADYAWFLEFTASPDVLIQIAQKPKRAAAFRRGDRFANNMYSLLMEVASKPTLRYLTI